MKKSYENPQAIIEEFVSNSYVAACADIPKYYYAWYMNADNVTGYSGTLVALPNSSKKDSYLVGPANGTGDTLKGFLSNQKSEGTTLPITVTGSSTTLSEGVHWFDTDSDNEVESKEIIWSHNGFGYIITLNNGQNPSALTTSQIEHNRS